MRVNVYDDVKLFGQDQATSLHYALKPKSIVKTY